MTPASTLVLGGAGFVGSSLVKNLLAQSVPVRVLSRSYHDPLDSLVDYRVGCLTDSDVLHSCLEGIDICYHLVSATVPATSNQDVLFDLDANLRTTVFLLKACVESGVRKVVFASSGGTVYGSATSWPVSEEQPLRPISAYGLSKVASEMYLELFRNLHSLEYGVARLSNPYGPHQSLSRGQGVVPIFLDKVARGEAISIWGDGSVIRDYILVDDAVDAMIKIGANKSSDRIFNVGSGVGVSLNELISTIEIVVGKKAKVEYFSSRPSDVPINVLDCNKINNVLGWKARNNLMQGLLKTWECMCRIYKY